MQAYKNSGSNAVVINTSYSDAVIPWLKLAGMPYPDFGSGNINHLIPRIKFAAASLLDIKDYWNIDITFATSHFHNVVISKEGYTENVTQLVCIKYNDEKLVLDMDKVFGMCKIQMPIDGKRNMMNASSNFEIIKGILSVLRNNHKVKTSLSGCFWGNFGDTQLYLMVLRMSEEEFCIIQMS